MIDAFFQHGRRVRRLFSRTRWTAKLLRRPHIEATDQPGLIILQIDGLARRQFEQGLAEGRLPFLRKMIERGHYATTSFYSGVPSTTPAVQAEVMYGVRCAVPAFQFFDRDRRRVVRMFDAEPVHDVAMRLATEHEPLLRGGKSYSNIYAGGAEEARFCAETLETDTKRLISRPVQMAAIVVLYFFTILRVFALACLEFAIAIGDLLRGVFEREHWWIEVKFIPSRVAVSIVLREYVRVMTKLAIEEGSPVIYANFLGYDEQAHRRGPGSWFAHWVLKGLDGVIRDVSRAAHRSPLRDYEVIVFADHGQERTQFYDHIKGRSIEDSVQDAFADGPLAEKSVRPPEASQSGGRALHQRAHRLIGAQRNRIETPPLTTDELANEVIVTALGPLGHIYLPKILDDDAKKLYAQRLVVKEQVPLVLYKDAAGAVWAHNPRGRFALRDDGAEVLGADHPFLQEATEDLLMLCRHRNAGDLVISGWQPGEPPVTFVMENGSHGSVGAEEVRGFALVPESVPVQYRRTAAGETYLRGEDLYQAGREFLGNADEPISRSTAVARLAPSAATARPTSLRVMTYNVHSCIGLDGKVRPDRILQVIRSAGADVIALQEVDVNRQRSKQVDQARFIAEQLEMSHHYYAVFEHCDEQYGLAIISRWPLTHVQSDHLTPANPPRRCEARGAMWVELDSPWGAVQVINTHFGLTRAERRRQATMLLSDRWLGRLSGDESVVFCGDLNAGATSPEYKMLAAKLRDVQTHAAIRRPYATFPSPLPVRRLDYILVSRAWTIQRVLQPRTPTAAIASDHLPLCVDLTPLLVRSGSSTVGNSPSLEGRG